MLHSADIVKFRSHFGQNRKLIYKRNWCISALMPAIFGMT